MGSYEVIWVFENGAVEVKTIDGQNSVFLVNGHRLKKYFQPLSRKDFTQQVQQQFGTVVVNGNTKFLKIWVLLLLKKKEINLKKKKFFF